MNKKAEAVVIFKNPVKEELQECMLSLSGSGLLKDEVVHK